MYYVENENKIVLFDENKSTIEKTLLHMPQFQNLEIKQTTRPIVDFEWGDTEEYESKVQLEQTKIRIEEIKQELNEIDLKSIRPQRALSALGEAMAINEEGADLRFIEQEKLFELEEMASALRSELSELETLV